MSRDALILTALDGHPASLAWLSSVKGNRLIPLGVDRFGQCGDLIDLFNEYQLDADAIVKFVNSHMKR